MVGRETALVLLTGADGTIIRCWPIDASTLRRASGDWCQVVDGEVVAWFEPGDILMPDTVDPNIAPNMRVGLVPHD